VSKVRAEQRAAIKAAVANANAIIDPVVFRDRGLSNPTVRALLNHAIDAPERLLFMTDAQLRKIRALGVVSMQEILRYRARFRSGQPAFDRPDLVQDDQTNSAQD
jgi:hypothetical protein